MNDLDEIDDKDLLPTVTASEAKQSFGQLIMDVQREPVQISKSGKPVAVMMSSQEYESLSQLRLDKLRSAISRGIEQCEQGEVSNAKEAFKRVRSRVKDGS